MVHVAFRAGQVVGDRYRIHRVLGFGAMGSVWSARDVDSGDWYALKFMHPEVEHEPKLLRRFFQEAAAASALRHPCIVRVFGLGPASASADADAEIPPASPSRARDVPFLVMELLRGEPLESLLARAGPLAIGSALGLVRDLASALALAHRAGVVHRDLKPANVFLHREGGLIVPKILDFGVAKLTDADAPSVTTTVGALLGSPGYMSPEQLRGEGAVDGRSDLWSLGVILYRCIVGRPPFRGDDRDGLVRAVTREPHPRASTARAALHGGPPVPQSVDALLDRCLAKAVGDRFPAAEDLARAVADLMEAEKLPRAPLDVVDHDATSDDAEGDAARVDGETPTRVEPRRPTPSPIVKRRLGKGVWLIVLAALSGAVLALRARGGPSDDAAATHPSGEHPPSPPPELLTAAKPSANDANETSDPKVPGALPASSATTAATKPPSRPTTKKPPTRKRAGASADRLQKPDF